MTARVRSAGAKTPPAARREATLRLVIDQPVAGVVYSLQNKASEPVRPVLCAGADMAFEVVVSLGPGRDGCAARFFGDFVRSEGKMRQFIYIASGQQAGQAASRWSRRLKVDIHTLSADLIEAARAGAALEIVLAGSDRDGGPACATAKPLVDWRVG